MIISKPEIMTRLDDGRIRVFSARSINAGGHIYWDDQCEVGDNGIDVTIGDVVWRQQPARFRGKHDAFNPGDREQIRLLWELEHALTLDEVLAKYSRTVLTSWPPGTRFIVVEPHEQVLCITEQHVGNYLDTVAYFVTKSTLGRQGWQFCACLNQGNVNTCNRVVLEVVNRLAVPNILPVGGPIMQITFELLTHPIMPESIKCPRDLVAEWRPGMMLKTYYGNRH